MLLLYVDIAGQTYIYSTMKLHDISMAILVHS